MTAGSRVRAPVAKLLRAPFASLGRARDARRTQAVLALAVLATIPFGSLAELEKRVLDGSLVDSVSQGRFLISNCDDQDRNSYQMVYLKKNAPQLPMVYVLGGSSARECFETPAGLATAVSAEAGRQVGVRRVAGSMQKVAVQLAIIDNLPAAQGGIVVIGVHQISFICGTSAVRGQLNGVGLFAESPALQGFANASLGLTLDNSIRPGLTQYLDRYREKRGVSAFKGSSIAYHPHRYGPDSVLTLAEKRAGIRKWLEGNGRPGGPFDKNFALSAALLEECVKLARARGFEVVLMEDPQDIAVVGHAFDKYKDKYRPVCRYLRDTYGAHYVNLNGKCGLLSSDCRDLYHLIPSGRAKWMPKLANELAQVFKDHYVPPTPPPTPSPAPSVPAPSVGAASPAPPAVD
jgi:hypothetical protein